MKIILRCSLMLLVACAAAGARAGTIRPDTTRRDTVHRDTLKRKLLPGAVAALTAKTSETVQKLNPLSQAAQLEAVPGKQLQQVTGAAAPVKQLENLGSTVTGKLSGQPGQLSSTVKDKTRAAQDALDQSLAKFKGKGITAALTLEDDINYQPGGVSSIIYPDQRFVNAISLQGAITAFGIPLSLNYSSQHTAIQGLNGLNNNLFKFDFDPAQFAGMFKSDLQQYYDLRRTAFGGLDLNGYTKGAVLDQLKRQESALSTKVQSNTLSSYLNEPGHMTELMGMNEEQIRQRLTAVAQAEAKKQDPAARIKTAAAKNAGKTSPDIEMVPDINIKAVVDHVVADSAENKEQRAKLSHKEIDSVARTITGIKEKLQKNGVDINKMMQMQKMMDAGNGSLNPSELASSLATKKPAGGLQSLFSNIQALKMGSFGNQVPGATENQDLFMTGTHITYKVGSIPITGGYGSDNDLSSAKDANYQNSVYSSPKNITYLGAQIKQGVFGNVKLSMISSFGSGMNSTNNYATSSASSNQVAFTVTKDLKAGKLGDISVDVSKSTTLYNNNYQIGSDIVLAQKAGVNLNNANDLFESMGFNITQHQDIKALGMSDNFYFNYAGMGYDNPANNGYGGARKKIGGSLKKTFDQNKLTVNLRTDVNSMPISYTSDDQWRSYQAQLDGRYAVTKKFNLSLNYTLNGTGKQTDGVMTPVYSFKKIQIDGNLNYKIGKDFTVSHFSVGKQDYSNGLAMVPDNNTGLAAVGGSLLMASYMQSMVMGRNSLTASVFYNKELSAYSLIGNMLNSDISYQYQLLHKISVSTGLTYLDNTGMAEQLGIRQTIQLFSSKSFDMNTYVDLRKNMIAPLYPDYYPQCRAELSLKYHLRN